jgi:hypothetical protein
VELSPTLSQIAKSFGLHIVEADAVEYIKTDIGCFDFIYMIDVLEHIEKRLVFNFLLDIYNKLNPNGKLFLVIPNAISPAGSFYRYIDWTHETSFTPTSIQYLLENAGFSEIVISEQHIQEEPDPEKYARREWYEEAIKNYHRRKFYLDFVRWQASIFFGQEAKEFPLTPNMQVVAVKELGVSTQMKTIVEKTPGNDYFEDYIKNTTMLSRLMQKYDKLESEYNKKMSKIVAVLENQQKLLHRYQERTEKLHEILRHQENTINQHIKELRNLLIFTVAKRKILHRLKLYNWRKMTVKSGLFDIDYYLEKNPDVRQSKMDPVKHYILHGAAEGRNPNREFCTIGYLLEYKEILVTGENPLVHYIRNNK